MAALNEFGLQEEATQILTLGLSLPLPVQKSLMPFSATFELVCFPYNTIYKLGNIIADYSMNEETNFSMQKKLNVWFPTTKTAHPPAILGIWTQSNNKFCSLFFFC